MHFVQFYSVNQNRTGVVKVSGKWNLSMPLDVASNFSVIWAYNTIFEWQTPHIHVARERTSPWTAWHHLLIGWMCGHQRPSTGAGGNCGSFSPVWEALTCLRMGKPRIAQIQTGQKGAEMKCPRLAGCRVWAHCSRLVRPSTRYVPAPREPQAPFCFTCQSLFGNLTWFTHEQNPTKTK